MKNRKRIVKRRMWALAAAILVILILLPFAYTKIFEYIYPTDHFETVKTYSEEYGLEPYFVMALIKSESSFSADATSPSGAVGLMQLTPKTAKWIAEKYDIKYSEDMLTDPEYNIRLGCCYLSHLMEKYNSDKVLVLCAYNAGPGSVDKWLDDSDTSKNGLVLDKIPYGETRNYVEKIQKFEIEYRKLYEEDA